MYNQVLKSQPQTSKKKKKKKKIDNTKRVVEPY